MLYLVDNPKPHWLNIAFYVVLVSLVSLLVYETRVSNNGTRQVVEHFQGAQLAFKQAQAEMANLKREIAKVDKVCRKKTGVPKLTVKRDTVWKF